MHPGVIVEGETTGHGVPERCRERENHCGCGGTLNKHLLATEVSSDGSGCVTTEQAWP